MVAGNEGPLELCAVYGRKLDQISLAGALLFLPAPSLPAVGRSRRHYSWMGTAGKA